MSASRPFDTTHGGLQRLYYRVVMLAVSSVLALDALMGWALGQDRVDLVRLLFYGAILLLAWFAHELAGDPPRRRKEPRGFFLFAMGIISVVLCIETGGLASAFYMQVFLTCVFGALVMRPTKAFLLTSVLCAFYCLLTWVFPAQGGILAGQFALIVDKFRGGVQMDAELVNSLVIHCAFLFAGTWISVGLSTGFREKMGRLEVHAVRDPLTGLPNRRGFMDMLGLQIAKAVHWDWPVAILVLDLDHFKKVNDRFGHPVGDRVLAAAASLMREAAGPLDNVARIGGEEFAVAAVGAEQNNAADLADRIVRSFRGHDWGSLQPGLHVTCSVGVAIRQPGRESLPVTDLSALIDEADRALLQVKQHGRNGYLVASDPHVTGGRHGHSGSRPHAAV